MGQDTVMEEHNGHGSSLAGSTVADTSTQDAVGKVGSNRNASKISIPVAKGTVSEGQTQKSAKQRRRKAERDRKKSRAQSQLVQSQLQTIPAALSPIDHVMGPVEEESRGSQKEDPVGWGTVMGVVEEDEDEEEDEEQEEQQEEGRHVDGFDDGPQCPPKTVTSMNNILEDDDDMDLGD
ncbi:hypothetical protein BG011_003572 [Mortierella polycephala]|uniref:Uncharacterized protein n=1 Tax=Mortierella polycephala TaxID=41804 RepID=A0A9P6Q3R7_9FUNG|nr:hypothetical protein BG011_003572 [Mortierella polycephala]